MQIDALKHLGNCIRTARNDCGLTQEELAEQTGRGLRHIQNIEAGIVNPSFEVLSSIIKRLGMSADILFNPELTKQEQDTKRFLGKLVNCTDEERDFLLEVLDFMVELFIKRRELDSDSHEV